MRTDSPLRYATKQEFVLAYGGRCYCCGEARLAFLTMEHLGDDGRQQRTSGNGRRVSARRMYERLRRLGWPKDLGIAVACFNCNSGRAVNGGTCPHEEERQQIAASRWLVATGTEG